MAEQETVESLQTKVDNLTQVVGMFSTALDKMSQSQSYISSTVSNLVDLQEPLKRLSKTDVKDVQQIAASQIEFLSIYYNLVLEQARRSFRWALISAIGGFIFYLAAIGFLFFQQPQNIAIISLVSGTLVEFISAINFYLYGKTSEQLTNFHLRLDTTQRFLLANSICEGLEGEHKSLSRAELVRAIAGIILIPKNFDTNANPKAG